MEAPEGRPQAEGAVLFERALWWLCSGIFWCAAYLRSRLQTEVKRNLLKVQIDILV